MGFSCECQYQDLEEILDLTYHPDPKKRRRALQQMCPCQIMEGDMLWCRIIEMRWDKDKKVRDQALDFLSKLKRLYSDPDKNARKMCVTYQRKRKRNIKIAAVTTAAIGGGALAVVGVGVGAIVGALLAPVVLPALGFGAAGVTAGSVAAAVMTPTTAAGSLFAIAQSAGATGAAAGTITAIGAGAGAVVGAVGGAGAGAGGGALIGAGTALKKTS